MARGRWAIEPISIRMWHNRVWVNSLAMLEDSANHDESKRLMLLRHNKGNLATAPAMEEPIWIRLLIKCIESNRTDLLRHEERWQEPNQTWEDDRWLSQLWLLTRGKLLGDWTRRDKKILDNWAATSRKCVIWLTHKMRDVRWLS